MSNSLSLGAQPSSLKSTFFTSGLIVSENTHKSVFENNYFSNNYIFNEGMIKIFWNKYNDSAEFSDSNSIY